MHHERFGYSGFMIKRSIGIVLFAALPCLSSSPPVYVWVGTGPVQGSALSFPAPATFVDRHYPALATGSLDRASFHWSAACAGAAKIKIFRQRAQSLVLVGERGPFDTLSAGEETVVSFDPPMEVRQGDFIGIAKLTDCGSPTAKFPLGPLGSAPAFLYQPGDVSSMVAKDFGFFQNFGTPGEGQPGTLSVVASGPSTEYIARIIAVAASAPGAYGSFYRTSLQLHNPYGYVARGRIVFHPSQTEGDSSDPSLSFSLGGDGPSSLFIPDIVSAVGGSGLGSIDLVVSTAAPPGFWNLSGKKVEDSNRRSIVGPQYTPTPLPFGLPPSAVARIVNEGNSSDRPGFTQTPIDPTSTSDPLIFRGGSAALLLAPPDLTASRFNVGVRTLFRGAWLLVKVAGKKGVRSSINRFYPPTWFEQVDAGIFAGISIEPGDVLYITVYRGDVIIYGAATDNASNDASIQWAQRVERLPF